MHTCLILTHKLIVNPPDINELYDLVADPHELTKQIDNPIYADVRRDLYRILYKELKVRGDNFYHWMTSMFDVSENVADASLSQYKLCYVLRNAAVTGLTVC